MEDLAADFIIENNQPLELEAELSEPEHFDCIFELYASGTTWGNISGSIQDQTDLQEALNGKANVSDVESITGALSDSIIAVDNKYDSITGSLSDSITALDSVVSSNYTTLDGKIDSVGGALSDSITALDSVVSGKADTTYVDSITGSLSDSISGIDSIISNYGDIVNYNAAYFATSIQGALADTALQPNDNISELNNDAGYITSASLPTVNNSSVVFQKNGTDFDTITLNQSNNDTINISVPTDTGDLTNGAGFLANNATGTKALAVGNTSQSTAEGGVAVGYGARANSTYATAVGEEARANNTNTTVIGKAAKATEARAIAIGSGAEANAQDAIAIKGINNTANTFQVYTYNMLDMSTGLIPDARISSNIARTVDIPSLTNYVTTNTAQTISQTKAFSQPLVIADNNGLASGTILSNKKILQRSSGDSTLTLNNKDNKLRLVGSETRPKYSADGSTFGDLALYSDVTAISDLIPSAATSSNKLTDKQYVDDAISTNTADFDGSWATYADIPSTVAGFTNENLPEPTNNNYLVVLEDETQDGGTWRYKYVDDGNGYDKANWNVEYEINETPLTQTQWDAINSGITSADVSLIGTALQPNDSISALTNDSGYITGIDSTDVINALGYTPYSDANPNGYITAASLPTDYYTKSEIDAIIPQPSKVPIVYYQPTDSYCYTESNNRFYGSHVFEKLYLVEPKTSGTTQVIDMSTTFSLSFTIEYQKAPSSAITVAEIMTSYAAGKGVLLQLNSTGLYYRNNITGTTITGTRALTAGNSYDIKAEYDGTHMIISYKLSSDANYTQINSTTCTCDGSNYNYAAIGMNADNGNISLSSVVLTNGADTLYSYTAGKIALDYDGSTLKLNASNQLSVDFTGYATETWVGNQGYALSSSLATVATSGDYDDLINKPTIPAAQVQSDWDQADSTAVDYIKNKPTIPSGVIVDQVYDGTSANAQSGVAIAGAGFLTGINSTDVTNALGYTPYSNANPDGYITSAALSSYVDLSSAQNISGTKTFVGQKKILFKQSSSSDKLGFTLYTSADAELGALEYRPNTISGSALLNLNCPYSADYVGFRYWGTAVNVVAPKVATAGTYYIPVNITDGNTTVTAANTGTVNISSLLPTVPTNISAFTNDSGYITSSALSGYATETWVGQQGYALTSSLAAVATSGDYDDLINKPTIPTALSDLTVSAGSNITISGDTISATDTTYSDFTGADSITAGSSGLVPAPSAGDEDKILTGGATWNELKTVNSTSLLGSGNIDTSEIFVATYGTTTYLEISNNLSAGKTVFCKYANGIFNYNYGTATKYYFTGIDFLNANYTLIVESNGTWSITTTDLANTDLNNLTATGQTAIDNSVIAILELIYPVGAIFIGTTATCPMAQFFGTWTLEASDKALYGSSSNHSANTTISASLPEMTAVSDGGHSHNRGTMDIQGTIGNLGTQMRGTGTPNRSGAFTLTTESNSYAGYSSNNGTAITKITFKASDNWSGTTNTTGAHTHTVQWTDHVGTTVQPDAYVVNVWRRTA